MTPTITDYESYLKKKQSIVLFKIRYFEEKGYVTVAEQDMDWQLPEGTPKPRGSILEPGSKNSFIFYNFPFYERYLLVIHRS